MAAGTVYVSARADALTVSLGHARIYAFDAVGRLLYAYRDHAGYKRGLDNRLMQKQSRPGPGRAWRVRRDVGPRDKERFFAALRDDLLAARAAVAAGAARLVGAAPREPALAWLDRCLAMDLPALAADGARFRAVYKPVGILPPDQYLSVVLQATEGCAYNRCTFCTFYRDRPFRIKPLAEFRAHLAAVREFLGAGIRLRRSLFLADANALLAPRPVLEPMLAAVWEQFSRDDFRGIYSFMDVFTGVHKGQGELRALADLGVRRVYLGVETGCDPLLQFLNKPGTGAQARELVAQLRAAGIAVGVIVMAGVGGEPFHAAHTRDTAALLAALPLGRDDIVYISEFVQHPGSEYAVRARREGLRPLAPKRMQEQVSRFRAAAAGRSPAPRVAPYDIREFLY